jgi:hypothetical protein
VFQIGLTHGMLDKEEVIRWADNIIQQDEQPDHFVIELSLCGHKSINYIVSLINEFVGEPKPVVSGRVILGLINKQYVKKLIPLRKVTTAIYWMKELSELTETEICFMYWLDDNLDGAELGSYGTVEGVEIETLRFLEDYKDFSICNFDKWTEINKTIDEKIKENQRTIFKIMCLKFWQNKCRQFCERITANLQ